MASKIDLVKNMAGVDSTNGWDIVTSYTEKQLNSFLASQYDAGKLAKQVKLSNKRHDPLTGAQFTIAYTINFDSPKLSFIQGRAGYVNLLMPIGKNSSYTVTPQGAAKPTKTGEISGNKYSVKATIPLAAIAGDSKVTDQGQVIAFSSGSAQKSHVVIHFKNEKGALYTLEPVPGPADKDILSTYFLPLLEQYFQTKVNEIDYALAGVSNETPAKGVTLFTPKSFVFTSSSYNKIGVLSLYIQTEQSGNPPGSQTPFFQPDTKALSPVPDGFTASMIFSYALMTKGFLEPQLKTSGFAVAFPASTQGVKATLKKDVSVIGDGKKSSFIIKDYSYKELSISLNNYPLNLTILNGKVSVDWSGETTSKWSNLEGSDEGAGITINNGKVKITIDMEEGPKDIAVNNKGLTIPDFTFNKSNFSVHTKACSCKWYESLSGCKTDVPDYYKKDMKLEIPAINFSLHGFDYFRETNLLTPGKTAININSKEGVATPHDFLIVGDVATS